MIALAVFVAVAIGAGIVGAILSGPAWTFLAASIVGAAVHGWVVWVVIERRQPRWPGWAAVIAAMTVVFAVCGLSYFRLLFDDGWDMARHAVVVRWWAIPIWFWSPVIMLGAFADEAAQLRDAAKRWEQL